MAECHSATGNSDMLARMLHGRKRSQNRLFASLMVPVAFHLLLPSPFVLLLAALYFVGGQAYLLRKKRLLHQTYGDVQRTTLAWLRRELDLPDAEVVDGGILGFGYLENGKTAQPVLLHRKNDTLFIFKNPLHKQCVYAVENEFCYILEPDPKQPLAFPLPLPLTDHEFKKSGATHTDFLVQQQQRTEKIETMEMFVFDRLMEEARTGRAAPFLNCAACLGTMRREGVMEATLSPGTVLHIPCGVFSRLALTA